MVNNSHSLLWQNLEEKFLKEVIELENNLLSEIKELNKKNKLNLDISLIRKAMKVAKKYHAHQRRRSGQPYYIHPLEVARLALKTSKTTKMVIAALLHDVLEDTNCKASEIKFYFGEDVQSVIDAVTNLDLKNDKKLTSDSNYYKLNLAKDSDAIKVKICDRVHNMNTIEYMKPAKQLEKARETLKIYIPLAEKYNLTELAEKLKLASLKVLNNV